MFAFKKKSPIPKELNFTSSMWPIYYFCRVFGLLPFSVKFNANNEVQGARVSVFDVAWFAITICFYLILAVLYFQTIVIHQDPSASHILFFGDSIFNVIGLIFASLMIILDMCNRSKIIDILKGFSTFGKEVSWYIYLCGALQILFEIMLFKNCLNFFVNAGETIWNRI